MRLTRLNFVAIGLALVALCFVAVGLWPLSWLFTVASFACTVVSVGKTRRQISFTEYGIEITRRAREQAPVSASSLWILERSDNRRRTFKPFCECPGCGLLTFHLFGAPFEHTESQPEWVAGPGRLWVEEECDEVSVWNSPGTFRVRHRETGRMVVKKQVSMVVHRECLSCGREWTEAML